MTDIVITDITTGIVDGTGIFDKLMASVKAHIHDEYDNGRIKGPEYSQVYLGAIQAVLNQSVQYALQEKQLEAQIDLTIAQRDELLLNGVADRELKVAQVALAEKDIELKTAELGIREKELEMKVYEFDEMMPLQKAKLASDVEVATAQIVGMGYDNQVKEQQVSESVYRVANTLPKELEQITAQIKLLDKQVEIAYVDRVIKDKEAAALGMDKVVKVANTPATTEDVYTPKYEE